MIASGFCPADEWMSGEHLVPALEFCRAAEEAGSGREERGKKGSSCEAGQQSL